MWPQRKWGSLGASDALELRPEATCLLAPVDPHFFSMSWKSGDSDLVPNGTTRRTGLPCMEVPLNRTIPLWPACPELGAGSLGLDLPWRQPDAWSLACLGMSPGLNPSPLSWSPAAWAQIELCHLLTVNLGYSCNFFVLSCIVWKVGVVIGLL